VAASALALALIAVQRGGFTSGPAPSVAHTGPHAAVIEHPDGGTTIVPKTIVLPTEFRGHRLP
jgi:hypothetical protein